MEWTPDDVAFDLGLQLRTRRHWSRMTQQDVERASGVSASTLSRMELGRGSTVPLGTWVTVSNAIGGDLFGAPPIDPTVYLDAVARLAARAGWTLIGERDRTFWLDRPPRPVRYIRRLQTPAERAVVRLVVTLTDLATESRRLAHDVKTVSEDTEIGRSVGGVLVVLRTTGNARRLSGDPARRSHGPWIRALTTEASSMPTRPGVVWLAPRGTHLLPGA
ncbi:hypothetical protein BH20CHL7_BH20CHL7_01520 [soil metagenome]